MTLTELQYIIALADTKHFGKAARACGVSQPTLSVAVKKLEDDLGLSLFERARGNLQITPQGQQIIIKAKHVLQTINEIEDIASAAKDPLLGQLAIGTLPTVGAYLLPQCIPLLRSMARNLSLYVEEADTQALGKKLRSGELDAAILTLPFSEADVLVQPLMQEAIVALLPADHPLANKSHLDASDLDPMQTLLLSEEHCLRGHILSAFPHLQVINHGNMDNSFKQNARITGSSIEALRNMVASGLGITLLPASAASVPIYAKHQICVKDFGDYKPTRTIALAWRASFPRHQAIDVLRRAILASSAAYWHFSSEQNNRDADVLVANDYW